MLFGDDVLWKKAVEQPVVKTHGCPEREDDLREEMILEVIAWCRYEGTWIIEVRDIREDDTQEFDAVFLRPLTARDLVAISAPRHPLSTAIYPIHIR